MPFCLIFVSIFFFFHLTSLCLSSTCTQGPVFAIIGAWLMYQIQNRDVIANDASENMFRKAIIVTTLGLILCNLGPIDEWYDLHYSEKAVYSWNSVKYGRKLTSKGRGIHVDDLSLTKCEQVHFLCQGFKGYTKK